MRLIFIHGMRQEGKVAAELQVEWERALLSSWSSAGLARPPYTLEMPFYGDVLDKLTVELRGTSNPVVSRGAGGDSPFTAFEEQMIREMATRMGVTSEEINNELGREVKERGPANWQLTQAMARALERKIPALGRVGMKFVTQVDAYLSRAHIRKAVDDLVEPCLLRGRAVVVAHSLGTVVSFLLLRKAGKAADVPLFVTLGSPLGLNSVKQHLRPPVLRKPIGVARWVNGTDDRDYVALYSRLDRDSFADGIENLVDIHNRHDDAHAILDYLADKSIAGIIQSGISA